MPVIDKLLMVGLAALAMVLAGPAHAAATPQRVVEVIANEKEVRAAMMTYYAVSQLSMLYYLCPTEYKVDAEKQTFGDTLFNQYSRRAMDNFTQAHQARTGKLPSNEVLALWSQKMAQRQAAAKNALRTEVEAKGCNDRTLQQMDATYEQVRVRKPAQAAAAPVAGTTATPETVPAPTPAEPTTKN